MKRMLLIGVEYPRLLSIEWDEIIKHNILDYQGLLLDLRGRLPAFVRTHLSYLSSALDTFIRNGHTIFVILPQAKDFSTAYEDFSFLPNTNVRISRVKGETLRLVVDDPFLKQYANALSGHEIVFDVNTWGETWKWYSMLIDNITRPVCGRFSTMWVLHPFAPRLQDLGLKAIMEFFAPDYEEPELQPTPEWADQIISSLPGMNEISSNLMDLERKAKEIEELQSSEMNRKAGLARWAQLLWLDGIPLQDRVCEALNYVGVLAESKNPTAHTGDLRAEIAGREFVFEVTGSTGSIGVEKGRQLLQWIAESQNPTTAKGILVGNAFRNDPPDKRPPTQNHKIFVKELEDMSAKFNFGLLDVRELLRLVVAKLAGKDLELNQLYENLASDGIVRFDIR